ncbi:unnamed protein product [Cuscuta campestris]|uniref:Uncharacterized protein n=1 Tax=Cuscuta campestris TaxID=132261 RepID=A0A484M6E6_9ASTE|nr:unnamed protein product [Cuscuta campestris]
MDPNFLPLELNCFLGRKGLFHVVVKSEVGSPSWNGPRAFGVRSLVTDPTILSKYEHLVVIEDEEADRESEGLWASLEDLSQKVHEVPITIAEYIKAQSAKKTKKKSPKNKDKDVAVMKEVSLGTDIAVDIMGKEKALTASSTSATSPPHVEEVEVMSVQSKKKAMPDTPGA